MVSSATFPLAIIISTIALLSGHAAEVGAVDLTTMAIDLEEENLGEDVVMAVICRIEASGLFESDHRMMRRIAYVETAYGTANTDRDGGIWALSKNNFNKIKTVPERTLQSLGHNITEKLYGVSSPLDLEYETFTSCPLYSGLAARIFLWYIEEIENVSIPLEGDVMGQAAFWQKYYRMSGESQAIANERKFREEILMLEENHTCGINADIFFLLDASGSVGLKNFEIVKTFVAKFVNRTQVSPDDTQIGVITFNDTARIVFNLNRYGDSSETLKAIDDLSIVWGGNTNTADGICKLIRYGFSETNGARPPSGAVFRVVVVLTDGKSNRKSTECDDWNTIQAAEKLHNVPQSVIVYVVGVGNVNKDELEAIANEDEERIHYIDKFDAMLFQELREEDTYEMCEKASMKIQVGSEIEGTLDQNETMRYHYSVPKNGMTIRVCADKGRVVVYGSYHITTPNAAFHDWKVDVNGSIKYHQCHHEGKFVEHNKSIDSWLCPELTDKPTESDGPSIIANDKDKILFYLNVIGLEPMNNFTLHSYEGNRTAPSPKDFFKRSAGCSISYHGYRYWMLVPVSALLHRLELL